MLTTRRIWVLCALSVLSFAVIGQRLFTLQVLRTDYYEALAESQRQRAAELLPHRGTIYMKEGRDEELFPVAVNTKGWIVYAVPRDIEDPASITETLAPAMMAFRQRQRDRAAHIVNTTGQQRTNESSDTPAAENQISPSPEEELESLKQALRDKLDRKTDPYEPLIKPYEIIDDELRKYLEEKNLTGIVVQEKEIRYYPEGVLAAHILGYVGWQQEAKVGRYGVEGYFDDKLQGNLGFLAAERDATGQLIGVADRHFQAAQDGHDIVLTIDRVVQTLAEEELKDGVQRYGAKRGSVIVTNPTTGAVLAMATYPTFDPNFYFAIEEASVQRNPIVSELFEPGSILKPVIMAAAINEGKITPQTTTTDNGPVKVAEYTINTYDGKHHGLQTMTQLLEQSNNVGMVWVGQQLGRDDIYKYLRQFGLGEKTGIELEGETQSLLPEPKKWNITTVATASFGQGVALTPLQAINAINVIANQGKLMKPYIVDSLRRSDGTPEVTQPVSVRQVINPTTAEQVSAMMVSVIENGVATSARVPGYYLAGKTGTAQVPDERGKYAPDRKIISFVGFGPVESPKFSILIKLDDPAGLSFASGTSAPMFRNLATKLLNYYHISPAYDPSKKIPPPAKVPATTRADTGA